MSEVAPPVARRRRLAVLPEPYPAEGFDSWLARLAMAHFTDRRSFVEALVRESERVGPSRAPAYAGPDVVAILCRRTAWTRDRFESMGAGVGNSLDVISDSQSASYCPECWISDAAAGTRYQRRAWREPWVAMCEIHQVPLRETMHSLERLLCGSVEPKWDLIEAAAFLGPMCIEMTQAQRLLRVFVANGPLCDADRDRAQVLRDLILIAGMDSASKVGALVQWSHRPMHARGRPQKRDQFLCWRDSNGRRIADEQVKEPTGSLDTRRYALRVATLLMMTLEGRPDLRRVEDVSIHGLLLFISVESDLAWNCNVARRSWSTEFQARWATAFDWCDDRDPVCIARARLQSKISNIPSSDPPCETAGPH